jgi:hypothetical protein
MTTKIGRTSAISQTSPHGTACWMQHAYFDWQIGGTLNGNIRCYVSMYETQ